LVVKALLFGSDDEAFDDAVESDKLLTRELHDKWIRKGPVGKIHNWVVWVHRSDLLTNLLKEVFLSIGSTFLIDYSLLRLIRYNRLILTELIMSIFVSKNRLT
jgi:hypothetical protein